MELIDVRLDFGLDKRPMLKTSGLTLQTIYRELTTAKKQQGAGKRSACMRQAWVGCRE